MINFSSLSDASRLGRVTRLPLRLLPPFMSIPVLQGSLRGMRWIAGSSNHGCWLGSYELAKQTEIARVVKPGMVCYDIGAHVGFYTLLFAKLVGPSGRVFAFEPLPRNCAVIERHLHLNQIENVTLYECALADRNGTEQFEEGESTSMGTLAPRGALAVSTYQLDKLVSDHRVPPPDVIKLDVEGAEAAVLRGGRGLFSRYSPLIFLATHGSAVHQECVTWLSTRNYEVRALDRDAVELTDELVAFRDVA